MEEEENEDNGLTQTFVTAACFVALVVLFIRYDAILLRRHSALLAITKRSKGIVDQLSPSGVRDRFLRGDFSNRSSEDGNGQGSDHGLSTDELTKRNTLKNQAMKETSIEEKNFPTIQKVSMLSILPGSNSTITTSLINKRGKRGGSHRLRLRPVVVSVRTMRSPNGIRPQPSSLPTLRDLQRGQLNAIRNRFSNCSKRFTMPLMSKFFF